MRRVILTVVCLTLLGALAFCAFGQIYLWSGYYILTVHFTVPGDAPERVYCAAVPRRAEAERRLATFLDKDWSADPFRGESMQLVINTDGRRSPIFGELSDDPRTEKCLLVVAAMPDGRRVGKVVDIPKDYRKIKELTIEVP